MRRILKDRGPHSFWIRNYGQRICIGFGQEAGWSDTKEISVSFDEADALLHEALAAVARARAEQAERTQRAERAEREAAA
jgi:hypothetical protein